MYCESYRAAMRTQFFILTAKNNIFNLMHFIVKSNANIMENVVVALLIGPAI